MNVRRFWLSALLIFAAFLATDFVFHTLLLGDMYEEYAHLWRPADQMQNMMAIMYLGTLIFTIFLVFVFTKGYENRGLMEGVRYGLVIGVMFSAPMALGSYAMYPLPLSMAIYWLIYGIVQMVIAGMIVAAVYRPRAA